MLVNLLDLKETRSYLFVAVRVEADGSLVASVGGGWVICTPDSVHSPVLPTHCLWCPRVLQGGGTGVPGKSVFLPLVGRAQFVRWQQAEDEVCPPGDLNNAK